MVASPGWGLGVGQFHQDGWVDTYSKTLALQTPVAITPAPSAEGEGSLCSAPVLVI